MGNVDIFFPFRSHSEYFTQIFNVIMYPFSTVIHMSVAMQNPHKFLFSAVYRNLADKPKEFQRKNLGII